MSWNGVQVLWWEPGQGHRLGAGEAAPGLTHTFRPDLAVAIGAGALVGTRQVVALLAGAAVVQGLGTLVDICGDSTQSMPGSSCTTPPDTSMLEDTGQEPLT